MVRENFTPKVRTEIINYSDGVCMLCLKSLTSPKIAHIIPASKNGPRSEYRSSYGSDFIKSSDNGLCLCSDCHDLIDDEGLNTYSLVDLLNINKRFKKDFFVKEEYKHLLGIGDINHSNELVRFYDHLLGLLNCSDKDFDNFDTVTGFTKVSVDKKISVNNLYFRQAKTIRDQYAFEFIIFKQSLENSPIISEKIRAAVKVLYQRIKDQEKDLSNADLFDKMMSLMYDPSKQVIGNRIPLIYFFIICEVFSI
ncbi:HNH endonuclease [Enterococcus sp. AZ109]|uniref:HNH endonuclease n=1 Tax=Enterococcus sp. AZ109 TaxID=2774634 RepID=UPI003F685DD9